jgi:hypothetical protein
MRLRLKPDWVSVILSALTPACTPERIIKTASIFASGLSEIFILILL